MWTKNRNKRLVKRSGNGRFAKVTLRDFGISKNQMQDGRTVCAVCGYGQDEYWHPVLKVGYCPKCGSESKKPYYEVNVV